MSVGIGTRDFRNQQSDGLTHYPGFSLEAAKFLVESRKVVGLGIDTMSVDIGATTTYPVHLFTSQHRNLPPGERRQSGQSARHRSNGCGRAHQAGKGIGRPGEGVGAGGRMRSLSLDVPVRSWLSAC